MPRQRTKDHNLWKPCIKCETTWITRSSRSGLCRTCWVDSFGRKKYYSCEDCGVEKTFNQQKSPRCLSCERAKRAIPHYDNCIVCGKEQAKKNRRTPRCRPCGQIAGNETQRKYTDQERMMRQVISTSIRRALAGKPKVGSTFDYLPYTVKELAAHLEAQFTPEMTWENRGTYWHIDHIVPHSYLTYDSMKHPNFQKCWSLENLRPLSAEENNRKRAQIVPEAQQLLEKWRCQEQKEQRVNAP